MTTPARSSSSPAKRARRVTLKDIAHEAGLSAAAVSMALRDSRDVSAKTAARVKRIAKRLGYVPDPALSALASYRNELRPVRDLANIALVTNWSTRNGWTQYPNPRKFVETATARASELGFNLQHFWAREGGMSPKRFDQVLQARGIRGLLIAPAEDEEIELDWDKYTIVSIERTRHTGPFHFVEPDQYQAIIECWEVLLRRGYTRVGMVLDAHFACKWDHRWEAAHQQMQYAYCPKFGAIPTLLLDGPNKVERTRAWLREHRPQVVINRSEGFHRALKEEGLSIPEDLAYITLNTDDDVAGATGIQPPSAPMGTAAIELLHSLLLRNQFGCLEIARGTQISGTWIEGKTLPILRDAGPACLVRRGTAAADSLTIATDVA